MKLIYKISIIIGCFGIIAFLYGFANSKQNNRTFKKIEIHIDYSNDLFFVSENQIKAKMSKSKKLYSTAD